jgi:non-haem Fe2+, alpha-ketoglutarate-dependent halogenase
MTRFDAAEFDRRGYASALRCTPAGEMARHFTDLLELVQRPSPRFDRADIDKLRCTRNRHLDAPAVLALARHPRILDVVEQLLGPDLVLWRSDFFVQGKSDPETRWHQDRQFSGPRRLPSLVIADRDGKPTPPTCTEEELRGHVPVPRNVSAWLAIGDTDRTTGCVMVIEGSHRDGVIGVRMARPGETPIFGKGTVLDYDIPEDRIRHMELEAGEFFVFDRLTLHASVPTVSERPRIGLSLRYTVPEVLVYPGYTVDGQGFPVEPYKALLVRGEDRFGYNGARLEAAT